MKIYSNRTDLNIEKKNIYNDKYEYKTIIFDNINDVKNKLKKELDYFFKKLKIDSNKHIFIVGLGNENLAADSVGPKTLKHINVNSYLKNLNIKTNDCLVSALEPGVMGQTGILTERIIDSVCKEINPDLIIIIDSFVSNNIKYLNKSIQVTDAGLNTGDGLKGLSSILNEDVLGVPTLVIGVTTAVEVQINNEYYILSNKTIDNYVSEISNIISQSLNEVIDDLD